MFDELFTSPKAVNRYSSGPLLDERLRYLAHCREQGSTRSSLRLTAQHQVVLIDYLHLREADSVTLKQIEAIVSGLALLNAQTLLTHVSLREWLLTL